MEQFEEYERMRKQARLKDMQREFREQRNQGLEDGPLAQVAVIVIGVVLTIIVIAGVISLAEGFRGQLSPMQDTGNGAYHRAG